MKGMRMDILKTSGQNINVKARCLYCSNTIEGSRCYMTGGMASLIWGEGRLPRWLETHTEERQWCWNGFEQEFFLCPNHQTKKHFDLAFAWAKRQDKTGKITDFTNPLSILLVPLDSPFTSPYI